MKEKSYDLHYFVVKVTEDKIPKFEREVCYSFELIFCKDCKHRPKRLGTDEHTGLNLDFPDKICPCQCEDPWYSWMPEDHWYCANAERKNNE